MEQEFKQSLEKIRSAFKKGDMDEVARRANTSKTTVRKTFTRTMAVELTDKEQDVLQVCNEYFKERFEKAKQTETAARKLTT